MTSTGPYLPRFNDQADSEAAEHRRLRRDPDGILLAAADGTLALNSSNDPPAAVEPVTVLPASSNNKPTDHNIIVRGSIADPNTAAAEATVSVIPMAVAFVDAADNAPTRNNSGILSMNPGDNKSINDTTAPSQITTSSNRNQQKTSFLWVAAITALCLFVVAGVVVGGVCGSGSCHSPTSMTPRPTSMAPSPTSMAGACMTMAPPIDIATSTVRYQTLRAMFDPVYGAETFADQSIENPRFRALHWLANEDPQQFTANPAAVHYGPLLLFNQRVVLDEL
jgi:hypothetical protein